jgi:hypothetical protein
MKITHGNYRVVRACCESGNCTQCLAGWNKACRKRVVQIDGMSKTTAEEIAKNFARFDAVVEKMEPTTDERTKQ